MPTKAEQRQASIDRHGFDIRKKFLPELTGHLYKMWKDVEEFDLREEQRGGLCNAMATLQLAQEVQKLRLALIGMHTAAATKELAVETCAEDPPAVQERTGSVRRSSEPAVDRSGDEDDRVQEVGRDNGGVPSRKPPVHRARPNSGRKGKTTKAAVTKGGTKEGSDETD